MQEKTATKPADPFSDFFLKEAHKSERVHKAHEETVELKELVDQSNDVESRAKLQETIKTIESNMDEMLLANRAENNDETSLTHRFDTDITVDYHVGSLI